MGTFVYCQFCGKQTSDNGYDERICLEEDLAERCPAYRKSLIDNVVFTARRWVENLSNAQIRRVLFRMQRPNIEE